MTYKDAVDNRVVIDWRGYKPTKPKFIGSRTFRDYPLEDLREYIDWTPFFQTWQLKGKYPDILEDPNLGETATNLFNDAQQMLDRLIAEKKLHANAVIGFWPANSADHDDIVVYRDDDRKAELTRLHHLRQQTDKPNTQPNYCLADYIAPGDSGVEDYIGAFVVTAGLGAAEIAQQYEEVGDDYNAIMVKALADRLAEAFAERMHELVRTEYWGYAAGEDLDSEALIKEAYQGIRPAPGYPACPDHTEKETLFELLDATREANVTLTENFAMMPAASVSGFYFSHPDARYFGIGKIDRDQVESYAERKGISVEEAERWLGPVLKYK